MKIHDTTPNVTPTETRHNPVRWQLVPIRSIGPQHRERILAHLLALPKPDRYLRFGYPATDEQIGRYVASLKFERDDIFGIYNRRLELVGMAHLAYMDDPKAQSCAEFGVSVLPHARGRGYGARLFERAVIHARNAGVQVLHIYALSENTVMLKIAQRGGATVERDGSEAQAQLRLDSATLDSHVSELMQEQFAQADYLIKVQTERIHTLLTDFEDLRQGLTPVSLTAAPPKHD